MGSVKLSHFFFFFFSFVSLVGVLFDTLLWMGFDGLGEMGVTNRLVGTAKLGGGNSNMDIGVEFFFLSLRSGDT